MISSNTLPLERKSSALDAANGVVSSVSRGVKDMTRLVQAAHDGLGVKDKDAGNNIESGENVTAAAVATSLSQKLPDLFSLDGTLFGGGSGVDLMGNSGAGAGAGDGDGDGAGTGDGDGDVDSSLKRKRSSMILQPSLKKIRDARRELSKLEKGGTGIWSMSGSTWMDHVTTTFGVDALRRSGNLEKSKEGRDVAQYLDKLENESEGDGGKEEGDAEGRVEEDNDEGGSSDDEEDVGGDGDGAGANYHRAATSSGNISLGSQLSSDGGLMDSAHHRKYSSGDSLTNRLSNLRVGQRSHSAGNSNAALPPDVLSMMPTTCQPQAASGIHSLQPRAVRIAPAPEGHQRPIRQPGILEAPKPTKPKKKRGRKRKHPELTEEERKLARQEQNRKSAKMSRVRRKIIAAEYEDKMNTLVSENSNLKNQVNALNQKLHYMRSLLTLSVTPTQGVAAANPGQTLSPSPGVQTSRSPFLTSHPAPMQEQQQQAPQSMPHRQTFMQQQSVSPGANGVLSPMTGWNRGK